MTPPMLEIWPGEIESVMKKCFSDPVDRPNFCSVHEYLSTIENSGGGLTSQVLDGASPDWCEVHVGSIHNGTQRVRTRVTSAAQPSLSTVRNSEIYVMRRRSSSKANERRRSIHLTGGLKDTLCMFSNKAQTRREREVEQYGYQTAKQLELVRDIRRRSRKYSRPTWAKEVALTRAIARDLERVQNSTWKTYDTASKDKTSIRRGRKHSVLNEETFDRLLMTSSKYLKKDWSKVLHGMGKLKTSMRGLRERFRKSSAFRGRENAEACRSRRKLVSSELTEKHPPNTHSVAIVLASSSTEVADTRDTSKVAGLGSNVKSNTSHCSVNTEPCGSRKKSLTSELTEKRRPRAHSVVKVEVSPSAEIADTQDTSEVKEFGSKVKSNTLYCGVNTEPRGSQKNSLTSEFTEKRRPRAHSAAKAEARQSVEAAGTRDTSEVKEFGSNLKDTCDGSEVTAFGSTLQCNVNSEAYRYRKRLAVSEIPAKWKLGAHLAVKAEPSVVQQSLFDVSVAMLNGNGIKKDWTSPPCEHNRLHDASLKGESVQEIPKGQMLQQEFSFRDNDELAGNMDESESESVVRGKTLPSISGGSVVMKSNILRHSTETTSDISNKFDEAKESKRERVSIQLSPAFSGVRRCEPRTERLSSLRQEIGGRNSFNSKTMSFGTEDTSSVLYLEGDTLISRKKLKKVRSNFLGQEPTEGLTMKCNSLMTESVGRDDSALGNPKLLTYSRFAVGSSELSRLRRESFSSKLN
ncbi:hypothetical protein AWC38_SpisGene22597 [Stylophora pistillata]|uniref:Uncharacterized protein n=1 Tax=Stylophora pistillata TaxID=50429 RepID=A0A2B4RAL4_STYPI|nr:hypothetical protein AWC38_SpisGene22597 [Stylophora pistillata]